jgi:NADH-quinone oxidoreductase subunit I
MMVNAIRQFCSGLWAIGVGLWTTLRNNFRKPVTYQYAYAPRWSTPEARPIPPRYRGRFVLVREPETGELRCTGCKICAQACPGQCITVSAENRKVASYTIELEKCLFCGLCVEACPFEALGMTQQPVRCTAGRDTLHLDLAALAQPEEAAMPGVLPSTMGGDLRPGKQPFVPKPRKPVESEA